jgi:ABC-type multidrug transport system ATPase subunit
VTGLLGPNGAGKTTMFRILGGLLRPDSGRVRVAGCDPALQPREARARLGLLTEEPGLPERLTPLWHVSLHASLHGIARNEALRRASQLLSEMGLGRQMRDRHSGLSRGARLKVALARALVHEPRVLLLDDPMAGLDMESAAWMREMIRKRAAQGCAVLLATHNPIDAERLCDDLVIMGPGRVLASGPAGAICRSGAVEPRLVIRLSAPADRLVDAVRKLPAMSGVVAVDDCLCFDATTSPDAGLVVEQVRAVIGAVAILEVGRQPGTLEQAYHRLQQGRG